MRKFIHNLQQILPQVHNSHFPALIFGLALLGFYFYGDISLSTMNSFHAMFFILNVVSAGILIYFNQRKPIFYLLNISLAYILINSFKNLYSLDYLSSPAYINLCFFMPINLCFCYFCPDKKLLTRHSVYWLLVLFAEYTIGEKLTHLSISLALSLPTDTINLTSSSMLLFSLCTLACFIRMIYSGSIMDSSLFYAGLNIFAGFYYSSSPTALTIFFSAAALTILHCISKDIYYHTYTDAQTGLSSRNAYLKQSEKFPLKYSLGIVCIDNYEHLKQVFGRRGIYALTRMITMRMQELETEALIYRYSEDEFVLIFKNCDKKESYERLEKIRRGIASAEFMLGHRQKGLKLTVSCCVSEKKRSDDNSLEVLKRTQKALQKAYQFTQNVTSKA